MHSPGALHKQDLLRSPCAPDFVFHVESILEVKVRDGGPSFLLTGAAHQRRAEQIFHAESQPGLLPWSDDLQAIPYCITPGGDIKIMQICS